MSLVRKVLTLTGLKTINSGLGFALGLFITMVLGANELTDALFIAMFLPVEMARLAVSRMPLVLVPVLTEHRQKHGEELSPQLLAWWLVCLLFTTLIMIAAAPLLVRFMAPGLAASSVATAANLMIIMTPAWVLLGLFGHGSSLFYLNRRFMIPELGQLAWRVIAIAVLFLAGERWGVTGFSVGLVLASLVQLAVLFVPGRGPRLPILALKRPTLDWPALQPVVFGVVVAVAGLTLNRATLLIDRAFASLLGPGNISLLFFADRLARAIPLLLATSLFTIYLPELSKARIKTGRMEDLRQGLTISLMALGLPLSILLFWAAPDLTSVLHTHGRLALNQIDPTTLTIQYYSLGMPAIICGTGLRNIFLVERNLKDVVYFGLLSVVLTVVLDALLYKMGLHGLALASSLGVWVVMPILWIRLKMGFPQLAMYVRLLIATVLMAAFLFAAPWKSWVTMPVLRLGLGSVGALIIYAVAVRPVFRSVKLGTTP
jgi:putative peptidoglycan lipid II flippase